eukprot:13800060-Ditylum_brightwellii.AAC.1
MKKIAALMRQERNDESQKKDVGFPTTFPTEEHSTISSKPRPIVADNHLESCDKMNNNKKNTGNLLPVQTEKEMLILSKIKSIRSLYATALVCVLEPSLTKNIFTNPYTEQRKDLAQMRIKQIVEEQRRDSARERICLLLNALGRDFCKFRRPLHNTDLDPTIKIKIVFQDKQNHVKGGPHRSETKNSVSFMRSKMDKNVNEGVSKAQGYGHSIREKIHDEDESHSPDNTETNDKEMSNIVLHSRNDVKGPQNKVERTSENGGNSPCEEFHYADEAQSVHYTNLKNVETSKNKVDMSRENKDDYEGSIMHEKENPTCDDDPNVIKSQSPDDTMIDMSHPI